MKAFMNQMFIQFKMDFRDKDVMVIYYVVPLAFYLIMGVILKTVSEMMDVPFILSTTTFAITMTAYLGLTTTLVRVKEKGILKAYKVAGIPALTSPLIQVIITLLHMMIVSIIVALTAPFIFKQHLIASAFLHFFGVFIIGLASATVGVLLSCFIKSQSSVTMYGQLLFLPSILFSGMMFPANLLPKPLQLLGNILPSALGLNMLKNGTFHFTPFIVLLLISILSIVVSTVLYRKVVKVN